jgi:BNR/Asp-box repeat
MAGKAGAVIQADATMTKKQILLLFKRAALIFLFCATLLGEDAFAQRVVVGENVQVSRDLPADEHYEVWLAIDPNDPRRQLAASMVYGVSRPSQSYTAVYTSHDGGKSWKKTLDTSQRGGMSADPACAFGPDGTAVYAVAVCEEFAVSCQLVSYASRDGGLTWGPQVKVPAGMRVDRPSVAIDNTGGKQRGRVYLLSQTFPRGLDDERVRAAITLHRSDDGGASFGQPALKFASASDPVFHPGNSVVLEDGKLLSIYREFTRIPAPDGKGRTFKDTPGEPNSAIKVVTSEDGGSTISPATTVAESTLSWPPYTVSTFPHIAVDRLSKHFKGRLYTVWPDNASGRTRIMFSRSTDGGKKWSPPTAVDDGEPSAAGGPDNYLPTVAVNPRGIIGVSWYDRRESAENLGWHLRFAASADGGDTFGPSVRVSSGSNTLGKDRWSLNGITTPTKRAPGEALTSVLFLHGFVFTGGHTAGMEADASGAFHPLWVDNRTGLHQVWTASVTVEGEALPNGSDGLAEYADVSDKTNLLFSDLRYDPVTDTVRAVARLKNISDETIRGPVIVRALALSSEVAGRVEILNADNGKPGAGAAWNFTDQLRDNQLKGGETSGEKTMTFRLTNLRPLREGTVLRNKFVSLQARVLSGAAVTRGDTP